MTHNDATDADLRTNPSQRTALLCRQCKQRCNLSAPGTKSSPFFQPRQESIESIPAWSDRASFERPILLALVEEFLGPKYHRQNSVERKARVISPHHLGTQLASRDNKRSARSSAALKRAIPF